MTKKVIVFSMKTPEEAFAIVDKLFRVLNQTRIHCIAAAQLLEEGEVEIAQVGLITTADDISALFDSMSTYEELSPEEAVKIHEKLKEKEATPPTRVTLH